MHESSMLLVESLRDKYLLGCKNVLDVGSKVHNNQDSYRRLFSSERNVVYVGVDVEPGPNVDAVLDDPYKWSQPGNMFDLVLSGQTLEHVEFPWLTIKEMIRMCQPGGFILIVTPFKQREHRYPVDCYRFLPDGYRAMIKWATEDGKKAVKEIDSQVFDNRHGDSYYLGRVFYGPDAFWG